MRIYPYDEKRPDTAGTGETILLRCPKMHRDESILLTPAPLKDYTGRQATASPTLFMSGLPTGPLPVGTVLLNGPEPLFSVVQRLEMPDTGLSHAMPCIRIQALCDIAAAGYPLRASRNATALAWITMSDKGAQGLRQDQSGPAMLKEAEDALPLSCSCGFILPDDIYRLRAMALDLALVQGYDLILISGGTGVAPRDNTPESLEPVLEKRLPGFEQAMIQASLAVTPRGMISRAVAGIIGKSIVISLPGSAKAVKENLAAVLPAVQHALQKLQGDPSDCGR